MSDSVDQDQFDAILGASGPAPDPPAASADKAKIKALEERVKTLEAENGALLAWRELVRKAVGRDNLNCLSTALSAEAPTATCEYDFSAFQDKDNAGNLKLYLKLMTEIQKQAKVTISSTCFVVDRTTHWVKVSLPVGKMVNFSEPEGPRIPDMPLSFEMLLHASKQFDRMAPGVLLRGFNYFATMPFVARLQAFEVDPKDPNAVRSPRDVRSVDFKNMDGCALFQFLNVKPGDHTTQLLTGDRDAIMAYSGGGIKENCKKPVQFFFRVNKNATNRNFQYNIKPSALRFVFAVQPGIDANVWQSYWTRQGYESTVPEIPTIYSEPFVLKTTGSAEYRGTTVKQTEKRKREKDQQLANMTAGELGAMASAPPAKVVRKRGRPSKASKDAQLLVQSAMSTTALDYASPSASTTTSDS
jgi:hypothetical protein